MLAIKLFKNIFANLGALFLNVLPCNLLRKFQQLDIKEKVNHNNEDI